MHVVIYSRPLECSVIYVKRNLRLDALFSNFFDEAPSAPQNLQFILSKPTENTRPRMRVTWGKPAAENGIIKRYTLAYSYNYNRKVMSSQRTTNNRTLSYSFDVLGGLNYTVTVRAETIKPGPDATGTQQVPEYSK